MAYNSAELRLLVPSFSGNSGTPQIWSLQGTDAPGDVDAANFISDADARGMRKGDIVLYTQWSNAAKAAVSAFNIHVVMAVSSTGADLSSGQAVAVTNAD